MLSQSRKMGEGTRKLRGDPGMQNWCEPFLLEHSDALLFVEEQAQFGRETNIRDRNNIADQELAVG